MRRTIPDSQIHDADPEALIRAFTPWVKKIANRYNALLELTGAVDFDDLCQVGQLALLKAQEKYDPDAGSFLTFSKGYIRNAMRRELGISSDGKMPRPLLRLDNPLDEESEDTLLDLQADKTIEPDDERILRLERYDELHKAIGRLKNPQHREIIQRVYFNEQERKEAAADMGMKAGAFYSANQTALAKLRRDFKLRMLCMPRFRSSLSDFLITFTSSVEAEVLWKEKEIDGQLGDGVYMHLQ